MNKSLERTLLEAKNNLVVQQYRFILAHVPRWQRLLMEWSPFFRKFFNYSVSCQDDDLTKLTLLRGEWPKLKVVARNFDQDEYIKQKAYGHQPR